VLAYAHETCQLILASITCTSSSFCGLACATRRGKVSARAQLRRDLPSSRATPTTAAGLPATTASPRESFSASTRFPSRQSTPRSARRSQVTSHRGMHACVARLHLIHIHLIIAYPLHQILKSKSLFVSYRALPRHRYLSALA